MPNIKTDYGKKKLVSTINPADTANYHTPLFLLADVDGSDHITVSKCYCSACQSIFGIEDENGPMTINKKPKWQSEHKTASPIAPYDDEHDVEFECQNCGAKTPYDSTYIVKKIAPRNADIEIYPGDKTSYAGSYIIPDIFTGRYLFEFEKDGKPTRAEDNIMFDKCVIYPSGKAMHFKTEFSQVLDAVNGTIFSTRTVIEGDRRHTTAGMTQNVHDIFAYGTTDRELDLKGNINVGHAQAGNTREVTLFGNKEFQNFHDSIFGHISNSKEDFRCICRNNSAFGSLPAYVLESQLDDVSTFKSHFAARAIADKLPHPVYTDIENNGLTLSVHRKGSNESNTPVNRALQQNYTMMMIKYPAAVVYAAWRAEMRVTNYEFGEKRKNKADPSYEPKTATDSARAKFFREEMNYVAEQLTACDDKILHEIHQAGIDAPTYILDGDGNITKTDHYVSPSGENADLAQIMRDRLHFFAYGLDDKYPIPNRIATNLAKENASTQAKPVNHTKKNEALFHAEPIMVASNTYTLSKWGINNSDHVAQIMKHVHEVSPEVNPAPVRKGNRRYEPNVIRIGMANANVLAPVRLNTELAFLRLYGKTHNTNDMMKHILGTEGGDAVKSWSTFVECIKLYDDFATNPKVDIARTKDEMPTSAVIAQNNTFDQHDEDKARLRSYLENSSKQGSIEKAYQDFARYFGDKTKETVDALAREIITDQVLDTAKIFRKNHSIEETIAEHGPALTKQGISGSPEEIDKVLEDHMLFSDRDMILTTRNRQPLFARGLAEMHDEMSELAKKIARDNEWLDISDKVKSLNDTIPVTLSELPASQWGYETDHKPAQMQTDADGNTYDGEFSFSVFNNRFDFVRAAQVLSNCVASHGYFEQMKKGSNILGALRNENNDIVACVEIKKGHGGYDWQLGQFQGAHDCVVDKRYSEAFVQYCEKHNIDYSTSSNFKKCLEGQTEFFYGDGTSDFHDEEYDPVLDVVMSKNKAEKVRRKRFDEAARIFGIEGDTITVPSAPEDLAGYDFTQYT